MALLRSAWVGMMARLAVVALLLAVLSPGMPAAQAMAVAVDTPAAAHADHGGHHDHHDHAGHGGHGSAAADLQCHCPAVGCIAALPMGGLLSGPAVVPADCGLPLSAKGRPLAQVAPPHKPPRI